MFEACPDMSFVCPVDKVERRLSYNSGGAALTWVYVTAWVVPCRLGLRTTMAALTRKLRPGAEILVVVSEVNPGRAVLRL